jgi:hypothetical protein
MVDVYVYDERVAKILPFNLPISSVNGVPIQSIKIIAAIDDPISYIAQKILWMLPEGEKMKTLYLCGHGATDVQGWINFGCGLDAASAWELGDLKGHFDPYLAEIQLHSCSIASNRSVGFGLCRAIANATGVLVTAAVWDQDPDGAFNFEGPTITAGPG